MQAGTKVIVTVNGDRTAGEYMHQIAGKKNRHCVGVARGNWRRLHWVTVSTKKLHVA